MSDPVNEPGVVTLPPEKSSYVGVNPRDGRKNGGHPKHLLALAAREEALLSSVTARFAPALEPCADLGRLPPFPAVGWLGGLVGRAPSAAIAASTYVVNSSLSEGQCYRGWSSCQRQPALAHEIPHDRYFDEGSGRRHCARSSDAAA